LRIYLNGETTNISDDLTLADLVSELNLPPLRIAIELNHTVVRRAHWPDTKLSDDDRIEIVHFVGGGT
jgi:thiamine biosynthesis protein ThiS